MPESIYLVRHAAPPATALGRYWGRADPGLDLPRMTEDVTAAREAIAARPDRLVASPLSRAARTAEGLAAGWEGIKVESDPDLAEIDFGDFGGLTFAEISERYPAAAGLWEQQMDDFAFPGGEAIPAFLERAERSWRRWTAVPEARVVVVTHGGVIAVWASLFLGLPLRERFAVRAEYATPLLFTRAGDGWKREATPCPHG